MMFAELKERLADKNITLSITRGARNFFVEKGFDPKFGARPMRRLIQKELEDLIAVKLISGELEEGHPAQVSFAHCAIDVRSR